MKDRGQIPDGEEPLFAGRDYWYHPIHLESRAQFQAQEPSPMKQENQIMKCPNCGESTEQDDTGKERCTECGGVAD